MTPTVLMVYAPDPTLRVGGGARYCCAHARAAVRAGFDVHVFCIGEQSSVEECELGTVHRIWSPVRPIRNLMSALHAPFLSRGMNRFLTGRSGPHILHAFSVAAGAVVRTAAHARSRGLQCATIATVWDCLYEEAVAKLAGVDPTQGVRGKINPALEVLWNTTVMRGYEGRAYRNCDVVHVNYESVRRLLVAGYGVDDARIHLRPYASETTFLPDTPVPSPEVMAQLRSAGVPLIVTTSRHVPRKGLMFLFRALAQLRDEGVGFRACIVGDGYLLNHHRQVVDTLGLSGLVRVVGRVPETYDYVQHADLFVLPSLEEGSGSMSMIEAMQARVPVIATRIDGIPEDVTDDESAVLVAPGDVNALAAAIGRLLAHPGTRQRLAQRAHETFQARFSADALTRSLVDAYATLT